jgi:putative oxidoreductase
MEQNKVLYMLARLCMAAIFIIAGVRKAMGYAGTVKYFGTIGLPMPEIMAPLVILIEIGGGLALLFGFRTQIIAIILALFTIGTAVIAHQFWAVDATQFSGQLNNFLKNIAMVGGLLGFIVIERSRGSNRSL